MTEREYWAWTIAFFLGSIVGWALDGAEGWPIVAPIIVVVWIGRWIYKRMTNV